MSHILDRYKSASQIARVFSESWLASNFLCPRCCEPINKAHNNAIAKDFFCQKCDESFELKSKKGAFGARVVDGAYSTMLEAVRSNSCPNLILLSYTPDLRVRELVAVPSRFLVEEVVIPRKPLGPHCRRAGWQGCVLNLSVLPPESRITCLRDFEPVLQGDICKAWRKTEFLESFDYSSRGWLTMTMGLIRRLGKDRFSLHNLYELEHEAAKLYPDNLHIRAKLRQQLQRLRDAGWLVFEGKGIYAVTGAE